MTKLSEQQAFEAHGQLIMERLERLTQAIDREFVIIIAGTDSRDWQSRNKDLEYIEKAIGDCERALAHKGIGQPV